MEKKTVLSPTLITAIVCVLASIAGAVGVDVTATEQAEIVGYAAFVDYARVLADAVRFFSDITQTRNNGAACITSARDFDKCLTTPRTTSDFPIADVNASDVFVKKVMRAFSHSIPASLP